MADLLKKKVNQETIRKMTSNSVEVAAIKNSKIIAVVVKPGSSKNEIVGYNSERKAWIVKVKAAAEKDAANKELLKFLRKETGKTWLIKKGLHSREKTLVATSS